MLLLLHGLKVRCPFFDVLATFCLKLTCFVFGIHVDDNVQHVFSTVMYSGNDHLHVHILNGWLNTK